MLIQSLRYDRESQSCRLISGLVLEQCNVGGLEGGLVVHVKMKEDHTLPIVTTTTTATTTTTTTTITTTTTKGIWCPCQSK